MSRKDGVGRRIAPPAPDGADAAAAAGTATGMVRSVRGVPRRYDEMRILVTRYWPRGRRREEFTWMRRLAPSADLLRRYKEGGIDWTEFAALYVEQIAADRTARTIISELHGIAASGKRTVVLYCHEPPGEPCHRHILREMVAAGRATRAAARRARFEDCRGGGRRRCAAPAALRGADLE